MAVPSFCAGCKPEEPVDDLKKVPPAWTPVSSHPHVAGRFIAPKWIADSVFFCEDCRLLLEVRFDKYNGRYDLNQLDPTVLLLFCVEAKVDTMVRLVLQGRVGEDDSPWRMIDYYLGNSDFSLEEGARLTLAGLNDSKITAESAGQLARMSNRIILRAFSEKTPIEVDLEPLVRAGENAVLFAGLGPADQGRAKSKVQDSLGGILARMKREGGILSSPDVSSKGVSPQSQPQEQVSRRKRSEGGIWAATTAALIKLCFYIRGRAKGT